MINLRTLLLNKTTLGKRNNMINLGTFVLSDSTSGTIIIIINSDTQHQVQKIIKIINSDTFVVERLTKNNKND